MIVRNGRWKFCTLIFSLMIASMVIPFQVLMVPLVSVYGGILDVMNHRLTLILMHVGFSVSMAVFMFHGAIKTNIPLALEEAATIDGCTRWQTWWKVVFPLLKPTIATVGIINAMAYWNDYLLPSLVLTKKNLYTIPIATQAFYGTYSTDIGLVMAALLLAMLPILSGLRRCQGLIAPAHPLSFASPLRSGAGSFFRCHPPVILSEAAQRRSRRISPYCPGASSSLLLRMTAIPFRQEHRHEKAF